MTIVLDLILVAIILVSAVLGSKRGFVRVLIELVGFIAILLLATWASNHLAEPIYEDHFRQGIEQKVEESLDINYSADGLYDSLPSYLTFALDAGGIDEQSVEDFINQEFQEGASSAAPAITEYVAKPILTSVIAAVLMFAIFLIGMLVVRLLAKWLNSFIKHTPFIGKVNKWLGAVVGLLKGIIIATAVAWLLGTLTQLPTNDVFGITYETVQNSYLCNLLNQLNPLL